MRSIQGQLTARLLAAFSLLVTGGGVAVYAAARAALYAQFDAGLRVKALVVVTSTEQERGKIDVEFSDRFLREFDDDVATDFFQVWAVGGSGNVRRSDSLGKQDLPRRFGSMDRPEYWNLAMPGTGIPARAIGIKVTPRVDDDDKRAGREPIDAVVVVAGHRAGLEIILRRIAGIVAAAGAGLVVATSVVVPLALRPGLRPLRRLARQAGAIDATNLGQRFPLAGMPAELGPICERLNALLGRLETSFERERRFSSDLAHELLTPLAELRALVESSLKWPDTAGPEMNRQSLAILLRMESLVTRLLELCRAENGRLPIAITTLSLPGLLRETWHTFSGAAAGKNLEVNLEGPGELTVATDAGLLRVIAANLFSNAVAYSPAGSGVQVSWSQELDTVVVRVTNPASGLEAGDIHRMFDRFWRKDPARTDGQHSGLGLAVARELAQAMGGQLEGELSADRHFTVLLTLAKAPAAVVRQPSAGD